jgi:hypothetical protein
MVGVYFVIHTPMALRYHPLSAFSHSLWLMLMLGSLLTAGQDGAKRLRFFAKYYEMIETE